MADENRIVFPDEVEEVKAQMLEAQANIKDKSGDPEVPAETLPAVNDVNVWPDSDLSISRKMADENRIVFPDEVEEVKAKMLEAQANMEDKSDDPEVPAETSPADNDINVWPSSDLSFTR